MPSQNSQISLEGCVKIGETNKENHHVPHEETDLPQKIPLQNGRQDLGCNLQKPIRGEKDNTHTQIHKQSSADRVRSGLQDGGDGEPIRKQNSQTHSPSSGSPRQTNPQAERSVLQRQESHPPNQSQPSHKHHTHTPSEHGSQRRSHSFTQCRPASSHRSHNDGQKLLTPWLSLAAVEKLHTPPEVLAVRPRSHHFTPPPSPAVRPKSHHFTPPPSPAVRSKSHHFTPPPSPAVRSKSPHFTPPASPGLKQKSAHSSPSMQTKNHHALSAHSYRNGKKAYSSKSEGSEDEKCLPQMESIMRQMASGKVTTDSLVNNFGGCGPFQVLLVLSTYSAQIAAVWGMMFMAFGNYHPKWWCFDDEKQIAVGNISLSRGHEDNAATSPVANGTSGSGSSGSDRTSVLGGGRSAFINPASGGVWSVRQTDARRANQTGTCSMYKKCEHVEFDQAHSTAASEWGLICEDAWSQSAIISIQMTGVLVGACLGGFIGDRRGRKISLYGHLFFLAVFNIVAIFSPSWQVFAFCRFLIGACVGAILACCILYPMEFVDVWWRGILGALPMWNVGAVSFSVAAWLLKDWKQLHIATAVLSILIFLPVFWVPESMRWLAVHGQVEDAKCVANKIASMNKRPPPNTTVLEIIAKEEKRMSRIKGTYSKYTVLDLFADRFIRRISLRMGFIWCCMSAVYYALSFGIKNFSGDFYINFIAFSAAEVPGMLFVAPATNKLGRRLGSVVYFASTCVCCAAVVVVSFAASASVRGTIITVLAMLAKMHILAVWMMVTVFCTELYPTVIRNLSIGYLNACARVGGIAAPFLLPNSTDFLFVSFIVMGSLMGMCCYLLKTLPETKGRPLEDTIKARSHLSIIVEETELEVRVSESA